MQKTLFVAAIALALAPARAAEHAKNVIVFLGDGMGPSTVSAASLYGYGKPQALYMQRMPFLGLSDTSSTSDWVTDSAAGMTAIVTGEKTDNGVLSLVSPKYGEARAGQPLKTILEYAEEHGLSTGVVSNSPMWDATPAACYAHTVSRKRVGEITAQIVSPKQRFGDGVDVVIGPGREEMLVETSKIGVAFGAELARQGFVFVDSLQALDGVPETARRVVALWNGDDFDLQKSADAAIRILSRNPKGYFLMIESNNHGRDAKQDIERTVVMDRIVERTVERVKSDTLVLVTADHSFDMRLWPGSKTRDILPYIHIGGDHTAEEVYVFADGPGADKVKGFFPNTFLFRVMMMAWGWE